MRCLTIWVTVVCCLMVFSTATAQETPPAAADKAESKDADESKAAEEAPPTPPAPTPPAPKPAPVVEDDDDDIDDDDDGWGDEDAEPRFPRMEHHGYFRFRADMFQNGHLGIAVKSTTHGTVTTSGFQPPLTENALNRGDNHDESILASSNIRFRYQPSILISESLKISGTFDVMDNLVLGSSPDFGFGRADAPISTFSGTQKPIQDSIRVKELYGEWKLLGAPLRFGRMSSHWGLGILANGGNHWDDDFGDYNDRIMLAIKAYGVYLFGGYDIVSSGPTWTQTDQPFGQAYDLTETDDVKQGFFGVFSRPVQKAEIDARREQLVRHRKPAFDWGLYTVYRSQKLDYPQGAGNGLLAAGAPTDQFYDDLQLISRDGWAVIPDLWLRFEYRPSYTSRIRLELEAAYIYGEIGNVNPTEKTSGTKARTIQSWGVAFEGDYRTGGLTFGFNAGAASGDDAEHLGFLDQTNFEEDGKSNTKITNFKFDRNYRVDNLLFREVVGGITNAWYAKPYIQYDFFDSPDGAIGCRLDVLVAGAMNKKAYPGNEMWMGSEVDVTLFADEPNKFYADVTFGLLFPGPAFKLANGYHGTDKEKDPDIAWTLQSHLVLKY